MPISPMSPLCLHCQLPAPQGRFCCMGCETAWNLLHHAGLDHYYNKASPSRKAVAISDPARWAAFDHEDFLARTTLDRSTPSSPYRQAVFGLDGVHCIACIWLLENIARLNAHVLESRLLGDQQHLFLKWKEGPSHLSSIAYDLSRLGYTLRPEGEDSDQKQRERSEWIRLSISGALAAAVMHIGLYFLGAWQTSMEPALARGLGWISALLALPVLTYGAWPFYRSSYFALRWKRFSADLLVSLALLIGFAASLYETMRGSIHVYYDSLTMVVFLLLVGRKILQKTRNSFLRPLVFEAWLEPKSQDTKASGAEIVCVPAWSLKANDRVHVKSEGLIPATLELLSSEAWIDTSSITGEFQPQRFVEGQSIPEGATNKGATLVGRIISPSQLHQAWNPPRLSYDTRRLSRGEEIFVVVVIGLSLCGLGYGGPQMAIALLVVACPCALALSEPLVLESLRRQSAERGILLGQLSTLMSLPVRRAKGSSHDKALAIVFDKTGTLTEGSMNVANLEEAKIALTTEQRDLVYSMAATSRHPQSRALAYALKDLGAQKVDLEVEEIAGWGLKAKTDSSLQLRRSTSQAESPNCVFTSDDRILFHFRFDDSIRPEAAATLREIVDLGFMVKLFSGDQAASVESFVAAHSLSFDETRAGLTPQEKAHYLSESDIFVGDGLNDREAMKKAALSFGIVGSAESNLQTAAIYLQKKSLYLIPEFLNALAHAKRSVQQNIVLSLCYNAIAMILVACGIVGPILCAIAMPLSSLSVYWLAHRRSFFRRPHHGLSTKD